MLGVGRKFKEIKILITRMDGTVEEYFPSIPEVMFSPSYIDSYLKKNNIPFSGIVKAQFQSLLPPNLILTSTYNTNPHITAINKKLELWQNVPQR